LEKHVTSYKNALLFCGVKNIDDRTSALELFENLHDSEKFSDILRQIGDNPFLKHRIEGFIKQTNSTRALGAFLEKHKKHLEWHIHRIWRVRRDIVHSAEYSLNLNLLSANLEYYLKSLLGLIIESLTSKQNIGAIDELYVRYQYANERLYQEMKTGKPELYRLILSGDFL
jgi:hypothetical protein